MVSKHPGKGLTWKSKVSQFLVKLRSIIFMSYLNFLSAYPVYFFCYNKASAIPYVPHLRELVSRYW